MRQGGAGGRILRSRRAPARGHRNSSLSALRDAAFLRYLRTHHWCGRHTATRADCGNSMGCFVERPPHAHSSHERLTPSRALLRSFFFPAPASACSFPGPPIGMRCLPSCDLDSRGTWRRTERALKAGVRNLRGGIEVLGLPVGPAKEVPARVDHAIAALCRREIYLSLHDTSKTARPERARRERRSGEGDSLFQAFQRG